MVGTALLEEDLPVDPVGIAAQRETAVAQVRQHRRGDAQVVVDDLCLGETRGAGYSTLSRLEMLSVRPSISTNGMGPRLFRTSGQSNGS